MVTDYTNRFLALKCRNNEPLTQSQQRFLYTTGLLDGLHTEVELQLPSNLHTAISFAKAYEQGHFPPTTSQHQLSSPTGPLRPCDLPAVNATTIPSPLPPLAPVLPSTTAEPTLPRLVRRLTPAELVERRRQDLCFSSDEIYVRGHRCARLFLIVADDYDQDSSTSGHSHQSRGGHLV